MEIPISTGEFAMFDASPLNSSPRRYLVTGASRESRSKSRFVRGTSSKMTCQVVEVFEIMNLLLVIQMSLLFFIEYLKRV